MRVGILETGLPPEPLVARSGCYDAMVARMLGPAFTTRTYRVHCGALPVDPAECPAYVITGSSAGVYDALPWIEPLKAFLREAAACRLKLVGLCFGHQIMAEAFGGRVEKSEKGWGRGLHRYDVQARAPWMDESPSFAVVVSHQDQVVAVPAGAVVAAGCAFAPNGMLVYAGGSAMSVQCHPEFEPDFTRALYEGRRATEADTDHLDMAVASLAEPDDRDRLRRWIRDFLQSAPVEPVT